MSRLWAPALLGALVLGLLGVGLGVDLPRLARHQFWSDGATYYAMTWSLVEDGDLRYQARDLLRVERLYGNPPEGIFLKRSSGGLSFEPDHGFPWFGIVPASAPRIYFAKAFVYPVAAAPFVALLGNRGFVFTNAVFLALGLVLAYLELRRRAAPGAALAVAVVLYLVTVTPLYLLWPMPEILEVGLVTAALVAWSRGRWVLAAVLLGIATHAKPSNLLLAMPLGLSPFFEAGAWSRRLGAALARGGVLLVTVLALYSVNRAVTGEWNYQGGRERKTFHGKFPFDQAGHTFGAIGTWMTTNQVGPLVEGRDDALETRQTGPLRAPGEIRASFFRNLAYFWIGRFGGAVPYFFPVVLAGVLFLFPGPRTREGALCLLALLASYLAYIWVIPDNWYGGGGTVGNRYFLNLLPLAVFFVPRRREWIVAAGGALAGVVFLAPIFASPMQQTLHPGRHAGETAYRIFPAELTMLNDLSVFTEPWRKKRSVGDTEGDPHKHWPADPKAYYLYFMDDGTFGLEGGPDQEGFWVRGGSRAEVVLRALEPVRRMDVDLTAGPAGDDVTFETGGWSERVRLQAGETRTIAVEPRPGFVYYDTFVHVLHVRSRAGGVGTGGRWLGSFVRIRLETVKRPRPRA